MRGRQVEPGGEDLVLEGALLATLTVDRAPTVACCRPRPERGREDVRAVGDFARVPLTP